MKVIAVHDAVGEILSLVVSPEEGPDFGVESHAGEFARTVEIPGLSLDMPDPEIYRRLEEVTKTFRVDVTDQPELAPSAQLVAKGGPSGS